MTNSWKSIQEERKWIPVLLAKEDGMLCALRFQDNLGSYELNGPFFLEKGKWYLIDPPTEVEGKVTHFTKYCGENAEITEA